MSEDTQDVIYFRGTWEVNYFRGSTGRDELSLLTYLCSCFRILFCALREAARPKVSPRHASSSGMRVSGQAISPQFANDVPEMLGRSQSMADAIIGVTTISRAPEFRYETALAGSTMRRSWP